MRSLMTTTVAGLPRLGEMRKRNMLHRRRLRQLGGLLPRSLLFASIVRCWRGVLSGRAPTRGCRVHLCRRLPNVLSAVSTFVSDPRENATVITRATKRGCRSWGRLRCGPWVRMSRCAQAFGNGPLLIEMPRQRLCMKHTGKFACLTRCGRSAADVQPQQRAYGNFTTVRASRRSGADS